MNTTDWTCKKFGELNPDELYAILRLRSEVFVVEQNCVFLDMDNKDQTSHHLMGWRKEEGQQHSKLLGYSRIVPAGFSYVESSIGRIVTSPAARGTGIGKDLLQQSIKRLYDLHGKRVIRIGAQYYLKKFYESFGFEQASDLYLEDGIEHIEMLLPIQD
ncbi:MAG TPA: GNAT family N-acetyltransferase [Puia sp.]